MRVFVQLTRKTHNFPESTSTDPTATQTERRKHACFAVTPNRPVTHTP
jgi:hypothetical protein